MSKPMVPRSVPILLNPPSTSELAFLIISSSPRSPHRSAGLMSTCCAGVCGWGWCDVALFCIDDVFWFVDVFGLEGGCECAFTCESPCVGPFDGKDVDCVAAPPFAPSPGVCGNGPPEGEGTPGGAFRCVDILCECAPF